jgi:hypothetical protein
MPTRGYATPGQACETCPVLASEPDGHTRRTREGVGSVCGPGDLTDRFPVVGSVKSTRGGWTVGDGQSGEVTMKLRKALLDIQTGAAPDTHGWMHPIT